MSNTKNRVQKWQARSKAAELKAQEAHEQAAELYQMNLELLSMFADLEAYTSRLQSMLQHPSSTPDFTIGFLDTAAQIRNLPEVRV